MRSDALAFLMLALLLGGAFNIATVYAYEKRVRVYAVGSSFFPLVDPSTVYCIMNRDYVAWFLDPSIKVNYPAAYEVRITIWQDGMPVNPWGGQGDVVFNSARPYQDGDIIATGIVDNRAGIWKYTVDVLDITGALIATNDPHMQVTEAVGGILIPVDRLALFAPYIGLASTILVSTSATVIYIKHVRRRKEKQ